MGEWAYWDEPVGRCCQFLWALRADTALFFDCLFAERQQIYLFIIKNNPF